MDKFVFLSFIETFGLRKYSFNIDEVMRLEIDSFLRLLRKSLEHITLLKLELKGISSKVLPFPTEVRRSKTDKEGGEDAKENDENDENEICRTRPQARLRKRWEEQITESVLERDDDDDDDSLNNKKYYILNITNSLAL
uniref:Uncharacterized protein n=1 Tax=Timema douglasi TaxID=61478 RepID=A0A7R8ZAU5_TIMDO|nr:unnamed protein product [Timema douglasi]